MRPNVDHTSALVGSNTVELLFRARGNRVGRRGARHGPDRGGRDRRAGLCGAVAAAVWCRCGRFPRFAYGRRQFVVLRTIRSGDEGAFVPSLAVLAGLILAFVGIGYLIFFIHHIAISIQASSIIAAAARETMPAVDHLFPNELVEYADEHADPVMGWSPDQPIHSDADEHADANLALSLAEQNWSAVPSRKTGYIESVNRDALLAWAWQRGTILRMARAFNLQCCDCPTGIREMNTVGRRDRHAGRANRLLCQVRVKVGFATPRTCFVNRIT